MDGEVRRPDPDNGGGDGGHVSEDGGLLADANADAGIGQPPATPNKVGNILVGQTITTVNDQEYYSSFASAMFVETTGSSSPTSSCRYDRFDECWVYDCPLDNPPPKPPQPRYAGAGTVSIAGGLTSYSFDIPDGGYANASSQQLLFEAGTVLRVSATGAEVPAFSNKALTVPAAPFVVQEPNLSGALTIPRARALAVSWIGAADRDVKVTVMTAQANVRSVSIVCDYPGAKSKGTIAAGAMRKLLRTDAVTQGYVSVSSPVQNTFVSGDWVIHFLINGNANSAAFTTSD